MVPVGLNSASREDVPDDVAQLRLSQHCHRVVSGLAALLKHEAGTLMKLVDERLILRQ